MDKRGPVKSRHCLVISIACFTVALLLLVLAVSCCMVDTKALTKCALKAEIDFHSGSHKEIKRTVIGYIPGRDLHAQVERFIDGNWYPVSRKWHCADIEILNIYYSWEKVRKSGWLDHGG